MTGSPWVGGGGAKTIPSGPRAGSAEGCQSFRNRDVRVVLRKTKASCADDWSRADVPWVCSGCFARVSRGQNGTQVAPGRGSARVCPRQTTPMPPWGSRECPKNGGNWARNGANLRCPGIAWAEVWEAKGGSSFVRRLPHQKPLPPQINYLPLPACYPPKEEGMPLPAN
jgi:hypothetical protein